MSSLMHSAHCLSLKVSWRGSVESRICLGWACGQTCPKNQNGFIPAQGRGESSMVLWSPTWPHTAQEGNSCVHGDGPGTAWTQDFLTTRQAFLLRLLHFHKQMWPAPRFSIYYCTRQRICSAQEQRLQLHHAIFIKCLVARDNSQGVLQEGNRGHWFILTCEPHLGQSDQQRAGRSQHRVTMPPLFPDIHSKVHWRWVCGPALWTSSFRVTWLGYITMSL